MNSKLLLIICSACGLLAQDLQTRIVARPAVDISKDWYLTTWVIGNARLQTTNNVNIFPGVGYRKERWWIEALVQRQWSRAGNQWMLDFRFQTRIGERSTLYIEPSPLLTRKGFYEFVIYERRMWKRLNVGVETENIHRPGLDTIGVGPRVSYPIATFGKVKLTTALAYRMHRRERDLVRLDVVFSRK